MTSPNLDPVSTVSNLVTEYEQRRRASLLRSFNAELKEITDHLLSGDTEVWHDLCMKANAYWASQLKLPE